MSHGHTSEWLLAREAKLRGKHPTTLSPHPGITLAKREADLHNEIIEVCIANGWLYFHGSTAHIARRTKGEPDFCLMLPGGRVLWIECKRKGGKLSEEQTKIKFWMEKLGHKYNVVTNIEEFINLIR